MAQFSKEGGAMSGFAGLRKVAVVLFLTLLAGRMMEANGLAQNGKDTIAQTGSSSVVQLRMNSRDQEAPNSVLERRYHVLPAKTDAARSLGPVLLTPQARPESKSIPEVSNRAGLPGPGGFYPADLSYFGGRVLTSAVHDLVYFARSDGSSWGDPVTFLTDLGASKVIHLTDQYVASKVNNRYTLGAQLTANSGACSSPSFCSANDVLGIAHAAAVTLGGNTGYSHILHIFLPSGVDTCIDQSNTQCYSPDNQSTFVFCAYHDSVTFNDTGKVLYTVEPYQAIDECGTPDLLLNDSTNSTLSHEVFETITDPDGDGWFAGNSFTTFGFEIADLCQSVFNNDGTFVINKRSYQLQFEYSNRYHACAGAP